MRRRNRPGFDYRRKPGALAVVQDRGSPRRPARRKTIGATFIEP
jgi:hypothetical protein